MYMRLLKRIQGHRETRSVLVDAVQWNGLSHLLSLSHPAAMILLLFLIPPAAALPANRDGVSSHSLDSNFPCLAIIITLFSILSILAALKHLYLKRRRIHHFSRDNPIGSKTFFNQSSRSTVSIISSLNISLTKMTTNNPFLVGFFGSPDWETNPAAIPYAFNWNRSSFSSITSGHGSTSPEKSIFPAAEFGKPDDVSSCYTASRGEKASHHCHPLTSERHRFPQKHAKSFPESGPLKPKRRYSLPETKGNSKHSSAPMKRHSSLKSARSRRSSFGSRTLRILEKSPTTDSTVSLPPTKFNPMSPNSGCWGRPSPNTIFAIPPLPPLPIEGNSNISLPFPLAPRKPKPGVRKSVTSVRPLAHAEALEAAVEYIRSSPKEESACFPTPVIVTQATFSPVVLSSVCPMSPNLPLFPSPSAPATLPRMKTKCAKPLIRPKRSPPVGPSPLRIMTLPENIVTEHGARVSDDRSYLGSSNFNTTKHNASQGAVQELTPAHVSSSRKVYPPLGLGRPSCQYILEEDDSDSAYYTPRSRMGSRFSSQRLSKIEESHDNPNVLIGLIKELVEETSHWDASLYMDENFKSLIQGGNSNQSIASSDHPGCR